MTIARHRNTAKWETLPNPIKSRRTTTSSPHRLIYRNVQTATSSISGSSRIPRGLLLVLMLPSSSSLDSVVALVAIEFVSVVPERSEEHQIHGCSDGIFRRRECSALRWAVVHIDKLGKSRLELGRRLLESALLDGLVGEHAGFGQHVSVVDASVMAPEAEVGEVGDEVAGSGF